MSDRLVVKRQTPGRARWMLAAAVLLGVVALWGLFEWGRKTGGYDRFEAARQIKDCHLARGVVVLTLYGDKTARQRATQAGVDAFVEKGTSIRTLSEIIQQVWSEVSRPSP